ncbi:MAG TPA: hypothetical protein VF018_09795, partial [Acidobacteriaceae bacterium]
AVSTGDDTETSPNWHQPNTTSAAAHPNGRPKAGYHGDVAVIVSKASNDASPDVRAEGEGMPGQVIHVGMDYWQRMLVLNRGGLRPKLCADPQSLSTLLTGTGTVDAVVISESPGLDVSLVTDVVRNHTSCPVILFPLKHDDYDEGKFDLVVPSLTPPGKWVEAIRATIRCSQETCQQSRSCAGS